MAPYLDTEILAPAPDSEALQALRRHLGQPAQWPSPTIRQLLENEFHRGWQIEAGQWLLVGEEHGYAATVVDKVVKRARRDPTRGRPDTKLFLEFLQEMAEAMAAYYFLRAGWTFDAWCPSVASADVDFRLRSPTGTLVSFQVKAPDEHGRVVNHKIVNGEYDERIVAATDKARSQLPAPPAHPGLIVVVASRNRPLTSESMILEKHLIGGTTQYEESDELRLHSNAQGLFSSTGWERCSGVVMLNLVRGIVRAVYANVTLLNPNASHSCELDWFSGARVCWLDGDRFRWRGGKPQYSIVAEGTWLTDERPF